MYLTPEEERIYDGELGWAYQVSMRILTRLGDLFGATRLIPISSAHVSGVSYKTIGDAPISFLEALVESGGKVKVSSTINPSVLDLNRAEDFAISTEVVDKQMHIIDLYSNMGVKPTLTCTPYYLLKPAMGSHLAWAESSAAIYANSILGAWTNREGGPSALAAAIIGKVPDYGMHRPEERGPNVLVKVEPKLKKDTEFGSLGIFAGRMLGDKIPVFSGLSGCTETDLKQLGAALAASGMTSMFYPSVWKEVRGIEKVTIEEKDLQNAIEYLSTSSDPPDLVFLGCPHCSMNEIKQVAAKLKGREIKEDLRLWVCTSRHVRAKAKRYVDAIESAGGEVLRDTCPVVTWVEKLGVDTLMTNSAKTAYYAPTLNSVKTILSPTDSCISAACGS